MAVKYGSGKGDTFEAIADELNRIFLKKANLIKNGKATKGDCLIKDKLNISDWDDITGWDKFIELFDDSDYDETNKLLNSYDPPTSATQS